MDVGEYKLFTVHKSYAYHIYNGLSLANKSDYSRQNAQRDRQKRW